MMTSTLQSCQASKTVNNQAEAGPSTSRSTLLVVNTSTSDIVNDNDEYITAGNLNNIIEDLKAVTAHNQKVIKHQ